MGLQIPMTGMILCTSENDCISGRTGDIYKNFVEIETVRYNLIKPAGQSSYNNAYYEEQRTGNNVNSAITGVGLIFDLLKLKR